MFAECLDAQAHEHNTNSEKKGNHQTIPGFTSAVVVVVVVVAVGVAIGNR